MQKLQTSLPYNVSNKGFSRCWRCQGRIWRKNLRMGNRTKNAKITNLPSLQRIQQRFLPLLVLSGADMEEEFLRQRDALDWTATTTATYWTAVIAAATAVGVSMLYLSISRQYITPAMKAATKVLIFGKTPKGPTVPVTKPGLDQIYRISDVSRFVVQLCFTLGRDETSSIQNQTDSRICDSHNCRDGTQLKRPFFHDVESFWIEHEANKYPL